MWVTSHAILLSLHPIFPAGTERHGHIMGRRIKQRDTLHLISKTGFGIASKTPVLFNFALMLTWPVFWSKETSNWKNSAGNWVWWCSPCSMHCCIWGTCYWLKPFSSLITFSYWMSGLGFRFHNIWKLLFFKKKQKQKIKYINEF